MPQCAGYAINVRPENLDDYVEDLIQHQFGRYVDDVDVDIDDGCVEVEVEIRHPGIAGQLRSMLHSLPELRGYRIRLDVEYDD